MAGGTYAELSVRSHVSKSSGRPRVRETGEWDLDLTVDLPLAICVTGSASVPAFSSGRQRANHQLRVTVGSW